MEPSDAELMRRWQGGDITSFEMLVHRWQERVARLLARLAGPSSAADLCQEVFLRVYTAGPRYREEGAFSTWIYRVVLNVARDAARRRRPTLPLEDHDPPDGDFAPPEMLLHRETVALIGQALDELPDAQREVLVLRHYEGLNFEEIARLTGTPPSTLKSRFAVALQRLRVSLEKKGIGPEECPR